MPWAPALIGTKTIQELYYTTIHRPEPVRASGKKPPPQSGGYGGEVGGPTNAHYTGAARGHCTLLLYY